MTILYVSTVFPAEHTSSTIYTDLAEALVSRGHEVIVVCSNERKYNISTQAVYERGSFVLRIKTGNLYDVGNIEKALSQLFIKSTFKKAIKKYLSGKKIDLILFEAPPVTMGSIIKSIKRLFSAPSFLMMKDIFPQNAVDLGMIRKDSFLHRYYSLKERELYAAADCIGCMSTGNQEYLMKHHPELNREKFLIFPNTKKICEKKQRNREYPLRKKYHIEDDAVVFVFGGNMGKPQGINFLCAAAERLSGRNDIFFTFVGRGTERYIVEQYAQNHTNVVVLPNLTRADYETFVLECDVGIVSLDYRFTIPNYPSRILSYFEYSMPVLCATDRATDMKSLIQDNQCGMWCPSNDIDEFCKCAIALAKNRTLRENMGMNGRKLIEERFSVENSIDLLEQYMSQ